MTSRISGAKDGVSERFVPEQDPGRLIEVEHVSRYRWAAQAARDKRVLDAGCGAAYGSRLLAEGGAREVVGVDIAASVLELVAADMPAAVELRPGDLRRLDFENDTFDVVVCFEVIEHFEDPFPVLDELVRVLASDGVLLISSPNRGVYQVGNPHHFHEFTAEELEHELSDRLANVRLVRQHDYLVSALLGDVSFAQGGGAELADLRLHKLIGSRPGEEVYTIAVAGDGALPDLPELGAMTGTLEMREWLSVFSIQTQAIADKDGYIAELEARIGETESLQDLLVDAEQRLASIPDLDRRIAELEHALRHARAEADAARAETRRLDERLMQAQRVMVDIFNSPSWQLTKPLRRAKRAIRAR